MKNGKSHHKPRRPLRTVMSNLGTSLLGESDGHRDPAAASAPFIGADKFPLMNKVCMGITAFM
jgi:hypothetical protein